MLLKNCETWSSFPSCLGSLLLLQPRVTTVVARFVQGSTTIGLPLCNPVLVWIIFFDSIQNLTGDSEIPSCTENIKVCVLPIWEILVVFNDNHTIALSNIRPLRSPDIVRT